MFLLLLLEGSARSGNAPHFVEAMGLALQAARDGVLQVLGVGHIGVKSIRRRWWHRGVGIRSDTAVVLRRKGPWAQGLGYQQDLFRRHRRFNAITV
jgi:hypothetical protein